MTDTPATRAPDGNGIVDVLKRPPFSLLVAGQTISQLGDKLHHMALIALVGAGATADSGGIELAKLSVVFTLPVIVFGPIAGAMVDRWDKRLTMIACDAMRTVMVALIPTLYAVTGHLWPVYVVAFCVFALGLFFNAAKMALIPELVLRPQLLAANAALTSIGRVATVAGIVGGGIAIGWSVWHRFGWSDYAAGFYMDSASFFFSVITLTVIAWLGGGKRQDRDEVAESSAAPASTKLNMRGIVRDIRSTLAVVRTDDTLRFVFFSVVLLAAFASSAYVVMTASVQTVMGKGTRGVGYLGGLLAVGLITGSLATGTVGRGWDKRLTILWSITTVGVLMVIGSIWFSFSTFVPVAIVGGAVLGPIMVSQDTLLHEAAPTGSRGFIFSTRDLVLGASFMICSLVVGGGILLASWLGANQPYRLALGMAGALICAAGVAGQLYNLRHPQAGQPVPRR